MDYAHSQLKHPLFLMAICFNARVLYNNVTAKHSSLLYYCRPHCFFIPNTTFALLLFTTDTYVLRETVMPILWGSPSDNLRRYSVLLYESTAFFLCDAIRHTRSVSHLTLYWYHLGRVLTYRGLHVFASPCCSVRFQPVKREWNHLRCQYTLGFSHIMSMRIIAHNRIQIHFILYLIAARM